MRLNFWKCSTVVLSAALATALVYPSLPIANADQPHMEAALKLLRQARSDLEAATPNKGGHRERAIQRTDEAIKQTVDGIEYARTHKD